jgi:hypothetical protein
MSTQKFISVSSQVQQGKRKFMKIHKRCLSKKYLTGSTRITGRKVTILILIVKTIIDILLIVFDKKDFNKHTQTAQGPSYLFRI